MLAANTQLQNENAKLKAELRAVGRKPRDFNGTDTSATDTSCANRRIDAPATDGTHDRASLGSGRPRSNTSIAPAPAPVLHPALVAFVPLSEAAGPARVQQRGIHALQATIRANPDDKAARSALRESLALFVAALQDEIGSRLSGQWF